VVKKPQILNFVQKAAPQKKTIKFQRENLQKSVLNANPLLEITEVVFANTTIKRS